MKKELVLVVGGSGLVGGEVARLLSAEGYQVRTTTGKKATKPDTVQVDLMTGEGLREAFAGVDRAFILSPGGYADQYKTLSPLIRAAKQQGLKKVVLMTALGANAVETSPFRRAEIELETSGLAYNIVRPNWFMQNFSTFWVHGIKQQGKILLPAGRAQTSFIDTRDIAAVVARLLTTDELANRAIDLTGPEALTHDEVAREITAATGRQVTYEEIEPAVLRQGLLGAGLAEDYTDFLLTILGFLKEGYNAGVTSAVRDVLGREPRSFRMYAQKHRGDWGHGS